MWKAFNIWRGAENMKKAIRLMVAALVIILVLYFLLFFLQTIWAHRKIGFIPNYQRVTLSEDMDYETIFLQTGLGKSAVEKLLREGGFESVIEIQGFFWKEQEIICKPVLGLFSRVDKTDAINTPPIVDLQPGDIIVTLSTHSAGWHHGHVGLVLDERRVLECVKWGENSEIVKVNHWKTYSNYAVLRVKNASLEIQNKVADFAEANLCDIPYRLTAGLLGEKNPNVKEDTFGTHCGHSVWYAWNQFGYDLDSDGGRLVTPYDLLCSEQLEVVQVYGMDPRNFL